MLGTSTPLHTDRSAIFVRESYNSLGSVERAFERVNDYPEFDEFLRRLALLLDAYGCGRNFGAFLLHRHFTPRPWEAPIEMPLHWGDTNDLSLVTRMLDPVSVSEFAPSRWQYNSDTNLFEALEYSTDPHVIEQWSQLLESPQLLTDIGRLLQEFEIADIIGFTIAKRQSLPKRDEATYVEISDGQARASVVTVDCKDIAPGGQQIPTVWIPTVACWCATDSLCVEIGCMTWGSEHIGDPDGDVHYVVEGEHKVVPCV